MDFDQSQDNKGVVVPKEIFDKGARSLAPEYGEKVARELELLERVFFRVAKEKKVDLGESDLDSFCRYRQAKLSVHDQQDSSEEFERVRLLNMLFEGCLDFLSLSAISFKDKQNEPAVNALTRADKIIVHLSQTLNFEQGEKIAQELLRLYDFAHSYLGEALKESSAEKVLSVRAIIEKIYSSYLEIEIAQDASSFFDRKINSIQ